MSQDPTDTPASRGASGVRRTLIAIVLVAALVALGAWGIPKIVYMRGHESTNDSQVDGDIVPVVSKVGGYVTAVDVSENQGVSAGELLVRIEPEEYEATLARAVAELKAAEVAAGEQAQSAVSGATSESGALGADLAGALAGVETAQRDLERIESLAEKQIVSQQRLDAARLALQTAQARVDGLREREAAAAAGVEGARAGVDLASARLEAARAAVRSAQIQLGHTEVTAPTGGIVSRKQVVPGQLVQPGQPLMSVTDPEAVWITANFKETQLQGIRPDAQVDFSVDAYPGCNGNGEVESIAPATGSQFALLPPDNATGNFTKVVQRIPVRIRIVDGCGPDQPLRPGMSVDVHVSKD